MFWSLIIKPGKKYSETVEHSFHVSKACLELSSATHDDVIVLLEHKGKEVILCHLNKRTRKDGDLNLNFQAGDRISFFSHGHAIVHLSGYLVGDDWTLGEIMETETSGERDVPSKTLKRAQAEKSNGKAQKKSKNESSDYEYFDLEDEAEEEEKPEQPSPSESKTQKKEKDFMDGTMEEEDVDEDLNANKRAQPKESKGKSLKKVNVSIPVIDSDEKEEVEQPSAKVISKAQKKKEKQVSNPSKAPQKAPPTAVKTQTKKANGFQKK